MRFSLRTAAIAVCALLVFSACNGGEATPPPADSKSTTSAPTTDGGKTTTSVPSSPTSKKGYRGTVDGTRYDPAPNAPTDVRDGPSRDTKLIYLAKNGEKFDAKCEMPGEQITDSRGYKSTVWFRIKTRKGFGYISDTWFGRAGSQVPRCDK